jgi:hypothetical protein
MTFNTPGKPKPPELPEWEKSLYRGIKVYEAKMLPPRMILITGVAAFVLFLITPFLGLLVAAVGVFNGRAASADLKAEQRRHIPGEGPKPQGEGLILAGTMVSTLTAVLSFIGVLTHSHPVVAVLLLLVVGAVGFYFMNKVTGATNRVN